MTQRYFPNLGAWCMSPSVLELSVQEMALDGRTGREGIVLWLGHRRPGAAEITTLVALRGSGVIKLPYVLRIEPDLMTLVTDLAIRLGLTLVGQIHSHGPGYGTDLSPTDRRYGFAVPGFLSVVAPDFCLRSNTTFSDCGVHVFEAGIGYRRLPLQEVQVRIEIIEGPAPGFHVVGTEVA